MPLLNELIEYSNACIADTKGVCQKHRWACMRFLRDVESQGTLKFPYVFDEKRAEQFFAWAHLFKHRKGILSGQFIELEPFWKFALGNVYGWVNSVTLLRRFNKFYIQIARKNAKSQKLGLVGTYELGVMISKEGEMSEVYCAATKTEQAKVVYDEAVAMIEGCACLKGKFRVSYGRIWHNKTGSFMRALSEEDRKTGDGTNPQCGIIDEYHAHETSELYDVVETGMGARQQPLLGVITTAGPDLTRPCFMIEYNLVSKILSPGIGVKLDNYFALVCELDKNETSEDIVIGEKKIAPGELIDDISDPETWKKANPIICSYAEGREYLKKKYEEALEAPEKMRNFLTKHMDVWVNQREFAYMDMEQWKVCVGTFPDLSGQDVYVGGDLSTKDDLTSIGFEFFINDKYYIKQHSFLPEIALEKKISNNKKNPWQLWVDRGYITITEGAAVDYRFVKKWMIDEITKNQWKIKAMGFDPWNASQLLSDLVEEYGEETVIEIRQGVQTLSEPTKDLRTLVKARRIVHENDPVLNFAVQNAVVRIDHNGNIKLDKEKSNEKIDPLAAILNAHVRAMLREPDSVYNERGLLSLA
jgi:phage terminase large subunit-like protein